jgi:hypothetical protein
MTCGLKGAMFKPKIKALLEELEIQYFRISSDDL